MKERHDELVSEMLSRGMNHRSSFDMPDLSHLSQSQRSAKADLRYNMYDLAERCGDCRGRIMESLKW
jgi:hypothetical protein